MYMKFELHDGKVASEYEGSLLHLAAGVAMIAKTIYSSLDDVDRERFRKGIIKLFTEYPHTWDVSAIEAKARAADVKTPGIKAGPLS